MCLKKLSKKDEEKELRKLGEIFPCWKVIQKNGYCKYDFSKLQPRFRRKIHFAEYHPARRMHIDYPPSFHAYLKKPILNTSQALKHTVVKCWARKEDINRIGYPGADFTELLAVAVSRITRK